MDEPQIRAKTQKKVKQVLDLMRLLQVKVEAHQVVGEGGVISTAIFWVDEENYPMPEPVILPVPTGETAPTGETGEAPTGETGGKADHV